MFPKLTEVVQYRKLCSHYCARVCIKTNPSRVADHLGSILTAKQMSQPTPPFAQGVPRTTDGRSSPPARVWDIGPSPLHETGLFATSNINVGEVILCELPLLEFNVPRPVFLSDDDPAANAALEQLRQRIRAMTTEEKKALLDIMWANSRDYMEIPTIEKLDEECEKTITNYSKIAAQLAETFVEHSFPFRGAVDVHRLYRNVHQLSHLCHPNAEAVWNPETGRLVVRAIAEIFDQDEITVPYVNVYNDRSRRWSDLGFQCRCTFCDTDEEAVVKSNTVRRLVGHALATLNRYRDKYFGSAVEDAQVSMAVARSICDQGDLLPMRFAIKVIADICEDINQASELVLCSDLALQ